MNLSWFDVNNGLEWTVLIVCGIVTIYWITITLKCVLAQKRIHWLSPSLTSVLEKRKISVIMPARNEAQDIAYSLHSILNQKNVDLEVIVVNDHSNDRTGEIVDDIALSDSRLKVLHNPPLAKGWLGKCNAMQYGAAEAAGDYLLFTDADIFHHEGCFNNVISVMQKENYDFISLFPLFENYSFWENINIPMYFFGIAKLLATPGLENPDSSNAVASGALMLINTTVFRDIGGFQGVKGEMFDDIGLARLLKKEDYRVGYRLAPECLKVRLFKTNLDAFWGTTKNILGAVEGHVWLAIPLIFLGFLQNWMPLFAVVLGILNDSLLLLVVGLIAYGVQYLSFFSVKRLLRFHPLKLLFFPLVAIVVAFCVLRALVSHTKGSILWRGREIKVRR